MLIGIVSDTHGNIDLLRSVADYLVKNVGASFLFHLGDNFSDVIEIADSTLEIAQVPGIYHPAYLDGSLPKVVTENILGLSITLVHALNKDITDDILFSSDIILHGHTHSYEVKLDDGKIFVNPGHLKSNLDKNRKATFSLLDINDRKISVSVLSALEFSTIGEYVFVRSSAGIFRR